MNRSSFLNDLMSPADRIIVQQEKSFKEAVALINETRSGIALVVNEKRKLCGVMTDGDIRRAILKGVSLDDPVSLAMVKNPFAVSPGCSKGEIFRIFVEKSIGHLPVVDQDNNILGICYESHFRKEGMLDIPVVIMAGGFGKRLRPHTDKIPKPMLEVGGKPILQILVEKFRDLGVKDFYITVNYLSDVIENHFGDGSSLNVNINYVRESKPLGTAGSLRMLEGRIQTEFLLMNADIMTSFDFKDMHNFHLNRGSELTVAVKRYDLQVPFGAVNVMNERLIGLSEKPELNININAGIYMLKPELINEVPDGAFTDMTDLIEKSLKDGKKVFSYSIDGSWMDIGRPDDYKKASEDYISQERNLAMHEPIRR